MEKGDTVGGGMYYESYILGDFGFITYPGPIKLFDLPDKEFRIHHYPIERGELYFTYEEIEGIIHYHIYAPPNTFIYLEQVGSLTEGVYNKLLERIE